MEGWRRSRLRASVYRDHAVGEVVSVTGLVEADKELVQIPISYGFVLGLLKVFQYINCP